MFYSTLSLKTTCEEKKLLEVADSELERGAAPGAGVAVGFVP